jgi:Domain of unknown function (DUF5666)
MISLTSSPRRHIAQLSALSGVALCALLVAVRVPAGIQGSGFRSLLAVGTITQVGSGFSVDGVPYATQGAAVEIDNAPGSQSQLRVGDIVTVSGTVEHGKAGATAEQISFSSNVRGPVSSVDASAGTFLVLGQTVRVTATTIFAAAPGLAGLAGLRNGDVVEVSGFGTSLGEVVASRIEIKAATGALRVTGSIQALNNAQHTFRINSLVVDFGNAEIDGSLKDGANVAVDGPKLSSPSSLQASRVEVQPPLHSEPGSEGRIDGIITDFPSNTYFEVNGLPVLINAQTRVSLNVHLGLDVGVKITGQFDSNGVLVADHVRK